MGTENRRCARFARRGDSVFILNLFYRFPEKVPRLLALRSNRRAIARAMSPMIHAASESLDRRDTLRVLVERPANYRS